MNNLLIVPLLFMSFIGLSEMCFINKTTISMLLGIDISIFHLVGSISDPQVHIEIKDYFAKNEFKELSLNQINLDDFVDGLVFLAKLFPPETPNTFKFNRLRHCQSYIFLNPVSGLKRELEYLKIYIPQINKLEDLVSLQTAFYHHSIFHQSFYQENLPFRELNLDIISSINVKLQRDYCPSLCTRTNFILPVYHELRSTVISVVRITYMKLNSLGPQLSDQVPYFFAAFRKLQLGLSKKEFRSKSLNYLDRAIRDHVKSQDNTPENLHFIINTFTENYGNFNPDVPYSEFLLNFSLSGLWLKVPMVSKTCEPEANELVRNHVAHIMMLFKQIQIQERRINDHVVPLEAHRLNIDLLRVAISAIKTVQDIIRILQNPVVTILTVQIEFMLKILGISRPVRILPTIYTISMSEYVPNFNFETFFSSDIPNSYEENFWFTHTWNRKVFELMLKFFASPHVTQKTDFKGWETQLADIESSLFKILDQKDAKGSNKMNPLCKNPRTFRMLGYFLFVYNRLVDNIYDHRSRSQLFILLIHFLVSENAIKSIKTFIEEEHILGEKISKDDARELDYAIDFSLRFLDFLK